MDINQIAHMIEWLDEERRRDKTTIATLEERLAQQDDIINTLQKRLGSIESDQTVMKESSLPVEKERDMMDQVRAEMRQLLETSEARRLTAEREAERRNEINREGIMRTIRDLTEKVDKVQRNIAAIPELRSEGQRVADAMTIVQQRIEDLTQKLEEPERRIAFLEEQRRQDARRVSELETEVPEVRKSLDSVRPKLTLIEDLSIRNERRIQEMQNGQHEQREQIQQFIDSQNLITQQRDQQISEMSKRFGQYDEDMERNLQRFETWSAAYREMKRIIDDFERIGDRLERRINEVAEMQRLSEQRFREEWNQWRDDDQKRWKQLTLSSDEVWRNHDKEFEQYVNEFKEFAAAIEPLNNSIQRLWSLERKRAELYRERYQALLLEYDTKGAPLPASNGNGNGNGVSASNGSIGLSDPLNGYSNGTS